MRSGHSAAAQALQANRETTALLCTTDVIALGALNFARVSGIDVPSQLSVTGFDGISDAIRENLTTVRQDAEEKGRRAGKLVLSSSHSGIVAAETLPTELFRGRTAAPPPEQPPAIA